MTTTTKRKVGRPKGTPKTGGKPLGYKAPATLAKEAAREAARVRITERMIPIIDAQIDSAVGIVHMAVRDPDTGMWERVTNPDQILDALNHPKARQGSTYRIYTKDPNSLAARDMLAYAIDKPKEQAMEMKIEGGDELTALLLEGRARVAARKGKK